jgi:NADPH:quinone reductase-like Zn-dependent oxidoreductase
VPWPGEIGHLISYLPLRCRRTICRSCHIYGALSEGATPLPVLEMIAKMPTIKAHNIWLTSGDETRRKAAVEFVLKGLEIGALKPVIDRTFKFDEMVEVHRYLRTTASSGRSL